LNWPIVNAQNPGVGSPFLPVGQSSSYCVEKRSAHLAGIQSSSCQRGVNCGNEWRG
jgi:hypothetical protein